MLGLYDQVAARLSDQTRCPSLLQVATGMNAEAAVETLALGPDVTALVHPLSDDARTAGGSMLVTQLNEILFGVTMILVYPGGFPQFEPARQEIINGLRGWLPDGASQAVTYKGGSTLQYSVNKDGGRWLHLLRFRVPSQETYEAQL